MTRAIGDQPVAPPPGLRRRARTSQAVRFLPALKRPVAAVVPVSSAVHAPPLERCSTSITLPPPTGPGAQRAVTYVTFCLTRLYLYLYRRLGRLWPFLRLTLTFTFTRTVSRTTSVPMVTGTSSSAFICAGWTLQ